ncbi:MAG: hypothetical protein H6619_05125 [Deltaproteobacteria bacterium]|nr:hypothetical protein [Deltaproteobacteria bacterium]
MKSIAYAILIGFLGFTASAANATTCGCPAGTSCLNGYETANTCLYSGKRCTGECWCKSKSTGAIGDIKVNGVVQSKKRIPCDKITTLEISGESLLNSEAASAEKSCQGDPVAE